jgi:hypothetical protein
MLEVLVPFAPYVPQLICPTGKISGPAIFLSSLTFKNISVST